jgi:hypothetical protein
VHTVSIAVNLKNPGEVLACYGILALDFLMDKQTTRSRFVESTELTLGADMRFRSGVFEFEHPDFAEFLSRCTRMEASVDSRDRVVLPVLTLDWYLNQFLGDSGNFSRADKLEFVRTHQKALSSVASMLKSDYTNLFSTPVATPEATSNWLSSYSTRKKTFQDAGQVYEAEDVFYASEWFLLIALQVFCHYFEKHLRTTYRLRYSTHRDWLSTTEAFTAVVGAHPFCRVFESATRSFGKGKVLRVAQEIYANQAVAKAV